MAVVTGAGGGIGAELANGLAAAGAQDCAGINKREGLLDVAEETYDRIMDVNLKGVFLVSQAVGLHKIRRHSGSIINIGSHNTGAVLGGVSVYAATKSGVLALTRSMAVEWAKHGIRANCVSPGHILTPLTVPTWEHPERSKYLKDRIAMQRPGDPKEIVGVCVLLASDASSYIQALNTGWTAAVSPAAHPGSTIPSIEFGKCLKSCLTKHDCVAYNACNSIQTVD